MEEGNKNRGFTPICGVGILPYLFPIYIYIYIRVRGYPLNGIFGPCACLLAGGCGACRLFGCRRRRRHSVVVYHLGNPKIDGH